MEIDLARPLIPKRGPRKEFEAVQISPDRYVLLPAGNCQPEPYSSLLVRSLGDIEEEFHNVPERRTLDCWVNVYREGVYLPYVCESKRTADKVAQSEPHKSRIACIHITQDYEVGEGLE